MTAAEHLSRLLALVPWLVAHPGVRVRECAEHFGISTDRLVADLNLIVVSGDEILGAGRLVDIQFWADDDLDDDHDDDDETDDETDDAGADAVADAVITVVDAQNLARPLRLTAAEAMSVIVGLRLLEQVPGVVDRETIASAAAKLAALTGTPTARDVAVDLGVSAAVRTAVTDALAGGRDLRIRYAAGTDGQVSDRRIRPYAVLATDSGAYLDAYCRLAGARRSFRLDRVVDAEVVGTEIVDADVPVADAGDEPTDGDLGPTTPSTVAVIDVDASARWVGELPGAQVHEHRRGRGARVRLPIHDPQWAVRLVLSLGGAAVVVDPVELAESVAAAADDALSAYPGH